MSIRSRGESSISCMQDIENMIHENKEKKKSNKLKRLKLFRNSNETNKERNLSPDHNLSSAK